MKVTYLSQLDPRWAGNKIGPGPLKMGRYGCTTTMLSMMAFYAGHPILPDEIASHADWYTDASNPSGPCLVLWNKLNIAGLKFIWRQKGYDKARILKDLADPQMLVGLQVNNGQHWVWLLGKTWFGDYTAADPLGGIRCNVLKKYKNITGSVHFKMVK
jgi:hypothetical protein